MIRHEDISVYFTPGAITGLSQGGPVVLVVDLLAERHCAIVAALHDMQRLTGEYDA